MRGCIDIARMGWGGPGQVELKTLTEQIYDVLNARIDPGEPVDVVVDGVTYGGQ